MSSLYLNRYRFTPKVLHTLIMIIGVVILANLGAWQLRRADEKRHIIDQFSQRQQLAPLNVTGLSVQQTSENYLPIKARGRYDNSHQFLLDNKVHNHQAGYEVITPFITSDKRLLLVNRGWVLGNPDRRVLPKIAAVTGVQQIAGLLKLPGNSFTLSDKEALTKQWPRIIQKVDLEKIAQQLGQPIFPFVLRLDKTQDNGFVRQWSPTIMKPQKHIGYAVQWFSLAAALFLFYLFINLERRDADDQ